jgi:hypothetical protein
MNSNFYLGLILLILGVLYGVYNLKRMGEKFDNEGDFGKSIIVKGIIGSLGMILVGLYLIFNNV